MCVMCYALFSLSFNSLNSFRRAEGVQAAVSEGVVCFVSVFLTVSLFFYSVPLFRPGWNCVSQLHGYRSPPPATWLVENKWMKVRRPHVTLRLEPTCRQTLDINLKSSSFTWPFILQFFFTTHVHLSTYRSSVVLDFVFIQHNILLKI